MKVIVDDKIPYIRSRVERLADQVVYLPGNAITPEDVRDADALIVRTRTRCDRRLLEGSRVRFIVTATIGYDHLDTAYLDEAGITWTNCPGCNAGSVAQYIRNSLILLDQAGITDLAKATVGIVGMGHVGCAVHEAISPYVGRILMNDPLLEEQMRTSHSADETAPFFLYNKKRLSAQTCEEADGDLAFTTLDMLMSSCDILTFHTPLIIDGPYPTYHLADEAFLSGLQRKPVLINAARGGVVDDAALERALDSGLVRAAVIDTWEGEPNIRLSLLRKTFIGTPHIAGYSADGKANATRMALEALERWEKERGIFRETTIGDIETIDAIDTIIYSALGRGGASGELPTNPLSLYNPLDDSRRLKQSPEQFEYQRGNYPVRYEKER